MSNNAFDFLGSVSSGKEAWRFKVRVLRLWTVASFMKPDQVNSIEMVLIDEKGAKIHATVRRQLVYMFRSKIIEGNVYKMSYFSVTPESGFYRPTPHPFKLNFEMKTKVQICDDNGIDLYGLFLTTIGDICGHGPDHDFLVDVVGLITGISAEREYIREGKVVKMIVLELSDNSGKCECALFGGYVKHLQGMIEKCGSGLPVAVIQFAKIKIFRGKVSIQNVLNATRVYINPSIPEVDSFRELLSLDGVDHTSSIPAIGPRVKPSFEQDFLVNYPKISIAKLVESVEDGIYVVSAVVCGLVDDEEWWYPACRCQRSVTADSGAYYCKLCVKHVFNMVPRFRVKLKVDDGTAQAVFVVFDSDMSVLVGTACHELVASAKAQNAGYYPPQIELLKNTKMLFKVEKISSVPLQFDGAFRVKRVCTDSSIMEEYDSAFANGASDANHVLAVEEECVEKSQDESFVSNLIVSPNTTALTGLQYSEVSAGHTLSEVINLSDNSDECLEVFRRESVGFRNDKLIGVKRNLSAAFSDCAYVEASTSKTEEDLDD